MLGHVIIKTAEEIEKMKAAGAIVEEVLNAIRDMAKPGVTTGELDEKARQIISRHRAKGSFYGYMGWNNTKFPGHICASVNEQVVHGFPGKRKLLSGDILSVDVGVEKDGWQGDAARTYMIGEVDEKLRELVRVTRECFFEGLKAARPGNRLGDIAAAVQAHAEAHGFGVVRTYVGHGIGRSLHEPPDVPNYVHPGRGRGIRLVPGMTLAVEPMINLGTYEVETLADHWTVVTKDRLPSAHYENTIAITDTDPILLTLTGEQEREAAL
jgi:methionyl aminopeptidase